MSYIVLDTDVYPRSSNDGCLRPSTCITFVTYGELTQWAVMRDWNPRSREVLARWLTGIPVLPGDRDVARLWGEVAARAKRRGRTRPQNDLWIAACCLHYGLPLATLNLKDFQDFADHEQLSIITA